MRRGGASRRSSMLLRDVLEPRPLPCHAAWATAMLKHHQEEHPRPLVNDARRQRCRRDEEVPAGKMPLWWHRLLCVGADVTSRAPLLGRPGLSSQSQPKGPYAMMRSDVSQQNPALVPLAAVASSEPRLCAANRRLAPRSASRSAKIHASAAQPRANLQPQILLLELLRGSRAAAALCPSCRAAVSPRRLERARHRHGLGVPRVRARGGAPRAAYVTARSAEPRLLRKNASGTAQPRGRCRRRQIRRFSAASAASFGGE
jgi:hypothetical protein